MERLHRKLEVLGCVNRIAAALIADGGGTGPAFARLLERVAEAEVEYRKAVARDAAP